MAVQRGSQVVPLVVVVLPMSHNGHAVCVYIGLSGHRWPTWPRRRISTYGVPRKFSAVSGTRLAITTLESTAGP